MDNLFFTIALKLLFIVAFFFTAPLIVGIMEHKFLGDFQARLGPMEAGPHGLLQLVADGIKFIQKEDIIPAAADKWVFALAPAVALLPALFILVTVPFGPGLWAENLDAGIFYALAISSVSVIGILMGAWSSANKYSLMGGLRAAAQLIAYELPLVLGAAAVVLQAGTLSLVGIVETQADFRLFGMLPVWYAIPHFIGFGLFYVASLAELNRPPFDMPIADSEIIFGHMTEYTGLRYAFFMLTEYAGMVVLAVLATVLFLGGWYPWPGFDFAVVPFGAGGAALLGFAVTFGKIVLLTFVMVWLRATFPRLREDQLQRMSWLILIPLGLLNIALVAIAKVVF
ncbi:MAG: NADH-quinone oxidoreductase subunit NuoH [Nitriliruptorales bacterium]|nr:NADH-quinone oxidoreductase subunit NuoH [Nitriliruptorales bacterium]